MGSDNTKLKKKLNDLEKKNRRLSEFAVSIGIDPEDDRALKKAKKKGGGKRSGSVQLNSALQSQADEDKEALIRRLRRDNEEFKRKIQTQQGDLRKLQNEKKRSGSTTPRSASRRGSQLNMNESEVQEMMNKLKKENYEMRNERNELRKERDALATQLQASKDKIKKLEALTGDDDALLKQLYAARQEAKSQRKQKRDLQAQAVKLQGISERLKKKLMALAKRVSKFDEAMGRKILDQSTANGMIDELASQLEDMIKRYERAEEEVKKLKKQLRDLQKTHEVALANVKDKLKERKQTIKERDARIAELQQQLEESRQWQEKNKKSKRRIQDLEDELAVYRQEGDQYKTLLAEAKQREKNYKKQLKMIESMPGNASMLKKIDRLHKMFSKLDRDQDGMLTFDEFQPGAADLGFGETWEEQKDAFDAMDKDD